MTATAPAPPRRWSQALLGWLEYLAYPVMAGVAFAVLSLGVVTWLPALAAAGRALQQWRTDGDSRVFTGTFRAFGRYLRRLLPHSLASTVVLAVLVADVAFLARQPGPLALGLATACVGLVAAAVPYHLAVAAVAAHHPGGRAREWSRNALWFAFGSVRRGTALLGAAIATPVVSLIVPAGPLLLSATVPLLLALSLLDTAEHP